MTANTRTLAVAGLGLLLSLWTGPARTETVGTACYDVSPPTVYALAPYRSAPASPCQAGDQIIRFGMKQPRTDFAKRRANVEANTSKEIMRFENSDLAMYLRSGDASHTGSNCELVIDDLVQATETIVMSVPLGEWRDWLDEVTHIDHDSGHLETTYRTRRLIRLDRGQGFMFHDILLDHRLPTCAVAFFVEFAAHLDRFYDQ
jgi:hypothetical protein